MGLCSPARSVYVTTCESAWTQELTRWCGHEVVRNQRSWRNCVPLEGVQAGLEAVWRIGFLNVRTCLKCLMRKSLVCGGLVQVPEILTASLHSGCPAGPKNLVTRSLLNTTAMVLDNCDILSVLLYWAGLWVTSPSNKASGHVPWWQRELFHNPPSPRLFRWAREVGSPHLGFWLWALPRPF